ncbi:MAG: class I SAM-dependent methyltransferase [FCB group bacterium]|nr:class I SAM-dependent methyltransferase [FCB group bacterium]MBL7029412.1 class I SAM-dependent methyltransferase [Candidatus Neomarinimicrobiota bacterium]MBL7123195.1 class I SAM-dependent methyltransferase [Candidatus Neomarinimicrobiota bacterium]
MNKAQKFWDKQAKKYDYSERQFESVFKEVVSKTKEYLNANDNVMDFGCATGTKTLELAEATKQIHGIDISDEMIKVATKKKNELTIMNASFTQGTIFDNDFEKASFDAIISYGVIHLLDDKEQVIQRIHELLERGGLFISTTACLKDKMALKNKIEFSVYLLIKRLGIFPLHLNMFRTSDVEKLISSQNFSLVKAEKIFHGITISFIVARKQ